MNTRLALGIVMIVAILGGIYYWTQMRSVIPETIVPGWAIYTNGDHGYSVQYPPDVSVDLVGAASSTARDGIADYTLPTTTIPANIAWYASTCVVLDKENASPGFAIDLLADGQFSAAPCAATGTSAVSKPATDTVTIGGKSLVAKGRVEPDGSGTYYFTIGSISVEYFIFPKGSNNGAIYNEVHSILSTLKPVPNFVPSQPPQPAPDNGQDTWYGK